METRSFLGEEISLLGFGAMRLPTIPQTKDIDEDAAAEMLDYGLSHGINYIDTAYMYHEGKSESFLGRALKSYNRQDYYLATKMPMWQAKDRNRIARIFEDQLESLQTDYFDFYLCHNLNENNFKITEKLKVYDYLAEKKEAGIIKHLGFSFHAAPDVLKDIVKAYNWEFGQIQLNYIDWEFQQAKEQYEILAENRLPCIVMEPVRGGTLANLTEEARAVLKNAAPKSSIASWAIRYCAQLPNVMTVLSGMSNLEQLKDNIDTLAKLTPFNAQETKALAEAVDLYKEKKSIPCTGCRYCSDCSQGVDVAVMFKIYNNYLLGSSDDTFKSQYEVTKRSARESNCTGCGNCLDHCPQNIDIPGLLEKMAQDLKTVYARS